MDRLLSTSEAARRAGVGPTAIKRWADQGLLGCVKTAGGHRRFPERELEALLRGRVASGLAAAKDRTEVDLLADQLLELSTVGLTTAQQVEAQLLLLRGREGSWHRAAPILGAVLVEVGLRWSRGEITVLQEHLSSERLLRALSRLAEAIPVPPGAPVALLATAQGDDHVLGLALVELCLCESGVRTRWAGRNTPVGELVRAVAGGGLDLLVVSASSASDDPAWLSRIVRQLAEPCSSHRVRLLLGGEGAWPESPRFGTRIRSFEALHDYVAGLGRG